ncbi:MAG TPA: FkbM family methyltransferase [Arenibaculum sp.]|nr:FkbM family methyltransferase [Arenibaculum sp.]
MNDPKDIHPFTPSELSIRGRIRYAMQILRYRRHQHHTRLLPALRPFVPPDAVVFDVGSHAGQFAKLFAGLVPDGRVHAFEPGSYARSILTRVLGKDHPNVTINPFGLGERDEQLVLSMPIKKGGSYGFGLSHLGGAGNDNQRRELVEIRTLDGFVEEAEVPRLDLVKADIEGWELRMLHGADASIGRFRPVFLLEVDPRSLARAGDTVDGLWRFMTDRAYEAFFLPDDGRLSRTGTVGMSDMLWAPKEKACFGGE